MNMNNKKILDLNNNKLVQSIVKHLPKNAELFLVGGIIRDILLGKSSHDFDFVIKNHKATDFAHKIAEKLDGVYVLLDEKYDIARVVLKDKRTYLDFAGCFGEGIEDDLNRRDLTLNSIAIKLGEDPELIDPNKGIHAIEKKSISEISEKNFIDDPLRIFRVFRFAAQLGFEIEEKTLRHAIKHYGLMESVAFERIQVELLKFFEGEHASKNLQLLKETGMLFRIFPELEPQLKVPPNQHHHLGLIDHSIEVVKQLEEILPSLPNWVQEKLNSEHTQGIRYISLLKLACLLHDLGKPKTWEINEEGRHRFIKHDDIGAEDSKPMLRRMMFSKNQIKYISKLIKFHIYPSQLLRQDMPTSEKAINKMFRKLEDETPDIIVLAMADRLSAQGPEISKEITDFNIKGLCEFLQKYKEYGEELEPLPKLLSGDEIIELLNIEKGPLVGKLIAQLYEAQISGEINTKEEAIKFIHKINF